MNKAIIIGNLGKDPEERVSQAGNAICKFSIATSERWTDKSGNKQEETEWHNITVFGKQAENCIKYLSKGRKVAVEGRIKTDKWEKDGTTHYFQHIIANNVEFLSSQSDGPTPNMGAPDAYAKKSTQAFSDDDIPF